MHSYYGEIPAQVAQKLADIKMLVCDVDGVFSDGRIYLGNNSEELKAFHTRDGHGIKALVKSGTPFSVITGRQSTIVSRRMSELGASYVYQAATDKIKILENIAAAENISLNDIAYIGDDMPDYTCMKAVGLAIAVNDAHPAILEISHYRTQKSGGFGAVREACDLIMQAQGTLSV